MSGKDKISCWQAFSNAGDSIQEAFYYLGSVLLVSTVMDVLEEYVFKSISQTPILIDSLS